MGFLTADVLRYITGLIWRRHTSHSHTQFPYFVKDKHERRGYSDGGIGGALDPNHTRIARVEVFSPEFEEDAESVSSADRHEQNNEGVSSQQPAYRTVRLR